MNKYTVNKERVITLAADITYYYAKSPFAKKGALCFSIYDYHRGLLYSLVREYDLKGKVQEIRINDNDYDVLEFKSLLKARELGWHIENETIFFKKNITNNNVEIY